MKRLVIVLSLLAACAAIAQDRPSELYKAYEDMRTAQRALKDAEARRDQGVESQPGERRGTATGGSRPTERYFGRQAELEQEVEIARRRYEDALKRWNDLK